MKYLVLWDIHWQYDRLQEILDKYFDISDKVIFLWNYIDRWKKSLKTLEFIINLKKTNLNFHICFTLQKMLLIRLKS
jgi:hypothetical protein